MSSETFSPWDSAEILGDNETIIEYLRQPLKKTTRSCSSRRLATLHEPWA